MTIVHLRPLLILAIALAPYRSAASLCPTLTRPYETIISTTSSSVVPGSVRLHFEGSYLGYAPVFGSPSATLNGNSITVTIPVTDTAEPGTPTSPPTSPFCVVGDVELGPLVAGSYYVVLLDKVTVEGLGQGLIGGGGGSFVWNSIGSMACSSTRSFELAPAFPGPNSEITLFSTRASAGFFTGTSHSVSGNNITVTDDVSTEFPTTYPIYCLTTQVKLGRLPPGTYNVLWQLTDFGTPRVEGEGRYQFIVGAVEVATLSDGWLALLAAGLAFAGIVFSRR